MLDVGYGSEAAKTAKTDSERLALENPLNYPMVLWEEGVLSVQMAATLQRQVVGWVRELDTGDYRIGFANPRPRISGMVYTTETQAKAMVLNTLMLQYNSIQAKMSDALNKLVSG